MKRAAITAVTMFPLLTALVACASSGSEPTTTTPPQQTASPAPTSAGSGAAPDAPEPVADGPCPYLKSEDVAQANGQRVTKVRTSADKPHPACFFYSQDGKVQLTVRVFVGEPGEAKAIVDAAAPVSTSNPAESPAGWKGGSLATDDGAVYAVAKGGAAVAVTTNRKQTIKARRIVEETITKLEL